MLDKYRQAELRSLPVAEQASAWFVALDEREPSGDERRLFVRWLKESPTHIEEFLQISALHRELVDAPEKFASMDALVAEAKANVVVLSDESPQAAAPKRTGRWTRRVGAAAAASLVATLVVIWGPYTSTPSTQTYQTGLGEQRSIVLDDDSMVTLNTESSVTIEYTESGRHATLHAGEALFDVAKNPDKPFSVDAGPLSITVVGTTFNVYRQAEQTVLTVVEGEVRVESSAVETMSANSNSATTTVSASGSAVPPDIPLVPLKVTAGERVAVALTGAIARDEEPNLDQATAWTDRRLVFDDEPLSAVFAEFNRYNRRQLILDAPRLAERRITGVFDARDADTLLGFVEGQPGVQIRREADQIRIVIVE